MEFNLKLDETQVNLILKGLQELAEKESTQQAIQTIGSECQRQAREAQTPKVPAKKQTPKAEGK